MKSETQLKIKSKYESCTISEKCVKILCIITLYLLVSRTDFVKCIDDHSKLKK